MVDKDRRKLFLLALMALSTVFSSIGENIKLERKSFNNLWFGRSQNKSMAGMIFIIVQDQKKHPAGDKLPLLVLATMDGDACAVLFCHRIVLLNHLSWAGRGEDGVVFFEEFVEKDSYQIETSHGLL